MNRSSAENDENRSTSADRNSLGTSNDGPFFTDEEVERHLEMARHRDSTVNQATCPPDDEQINVQCIWLTEFYGPSNIPDLLSGLEELAWKRRDGSGESIADYLRQVRTHQFRRSSENLGPIVRPDDVRWSYLTDRHETDLPNLVDYAFGSLNVVSPSITALTLQFVLTNEAAVAPFNILRRTDFVSGVLRKGEHFLKFNDPQIQKAQAARAERQSLKQECASWISTHLPGVFHNASPQESFPSCEFITLKRAKPFEDLPPDSPGYPLYDYLRLVELSRTFGTWESTEYAGAKLSVGLRSVSDTHNSEKYALTIAANTSDLRKARKIQGATSSATGEYGSFRFDVELDLGIAGLGLIVGLHMLCEFYERHLSAIRDDAGAVEFVNLEYAAAEMRDLQTRLVKIGRDTIPAATELQRIAESPRDFTWGFVPEFRTSNDIGHSERNKKQFGLRKRFFARAKNKETIRKTKPSLTENLRSNLAIRSSHLQKLEPEVRQVVDASSSLINSLTQERATSASFRLQRQVAILTYVTTFVAVISLIATIANSCSVSASDDDARGIQSTGSPSTLIQEETQK